MIVPTLTGRLVHDVTHRGITAWLLAALITGFYLALWFTESLTGVANAVGLDGKWTLYSLTYTLLMVVAGLGVGWRYRHNRYQVLRTFSVVFFQVTLGFAVPQLLKFFSAPEYYFSYVWPLKIDYFYPSVFLKQPMPLVVYSFVAALVVAPLLGMFFGKRWYCSWVCGCGGLANTFGEPWRHLSTKSTFSWKVERVSIHAMLVLTCVATAIQLWSGWNGADAGLAGTAARTRELYLLVVTCMLSGVLGTGLYPLGGTRVWCRFFCPMAALLGLLQKVGRYRIRVKKDMCISCGLCSTSCEMGIDVRAYAQANQDFTRASCVGCGLCAEVCPRGVLRLENEKAAPAMDLSRLPVLRTDASGRTVLESGRR
jgi:ferredoxin-type protein NapH